MIGFSAWHWVWVCWVSESCMCVSIPSGPPVDLVGHLMIVDWQMITSPSPVALTFMVERRFTQAQHHLIILKLCSITQGHYLKLWESLMYLAQGIWCKLCFFSHKRLLFHRVFTFLFILVAWVEQGSVKMFLYSQAQCLSWFHSAVQLGIHFTKVISSVTHCHFLCLYFFPSLSVYLFLYFCLWVKLWKCVV